MLREAVWETNQAQIEFIHLISTDKEASALYYASAVDLATTFGLPQDQDTELPPKNTQYAPILLLLSLQPAESAIE